MWWIIGIAVWLVSIPFFYGFELTRTTRPDPFMYVFGLVWTGIYAFFWVLRQVRDFVFWCIGCVRDAGTAYGRRHG